MFIIFRKSDNISRFSVLALVILFAACLKQGAILAPDSLGYISGDFLRSAGYRSSLKLMENVFGLANFFPIVVLQMIAVFLAVFVMAKTLMRIFQLPALLLPVLLLILSSPYLGHTGNYILTEGFAYPLFLFTMSFLLQALVRTALKLL